MTSASAVTSAAVGLALLTILAPLAVLVEGHRPSGAILSHLAVSTPPTTPSPCGGDYEGTSGTITSPNYPQYYPDDSDCTWTIRAPPNTKIAVIIEDFRTYESSDYLEIRDGNDSSAESLAKCFGSSSCPDVTSSSNTLYLRFYSDGSNHFVQGFKLNWFSVSCGGDYDGRRGIVTSPNYPGDYPVSINCTSKLLAPPNTRITVTFEDFSTANLYDYLEIRDGNDSNAQLIEKCSDSSCLDVISSNNTLYLNFYSSKSDVAKGFKLIWFTEPDCGDDYTGTKGAITSVNHPNNYPSDVDCVWTITTLPNTHITVDFEHFDTYSSSDYLQIRDGTDMNAKLLGRCSGSSCSSETSSNNSLYIHFHSNSENQATGFSLNWYADLLEDKNCYYCGNSLDSNFPDPACGDDNYNGHDDKSKKWNACYTTVHYTGDLNVERGGTENIEEDGMCHSTPAYTTCYCMDDYCNSNLCQNCSSTSPPLTSTKPPQTTPMPPPTSTTIHPSSSSSITSNPPITSTSPPVTTNQPATTSQPPTPKGPLQCFSCIDCNLTNGDTHVDTSEEFLTCFTAIELGNSHFVIRGGSPDYYEDGSCRHVDGVVYECYCTSNRCNGDSMELLLGELEK